MPHEVRSWNYFRKRLRFDRLPLMSNFSGGPSFLPTDLPNLALWLDSATGTWQDTAGTIPATANNDPVALWQDGSFAFNDVLQSNNLLRLVLHTNAINSRPVLAFNGVASWLRSTSFTIGSDATVAGVIEFGTGGGMLLASPSGSGYLAYHDASNIYCNPSGGSFATVTWSLTAGDQLIFGLRRTGATVRFYRDGTQLGTDQTLGVSPSIDGATVMADGSGAFSSASDLGELIVYTDAKSDADVDQVMGYLLTKWNI